MPTVLDYALAANRHPMTIPRRRDRENCALPALLRAAARFYDT